MEISCRQDRAPLRTFRDTDGTGRRIRLHRHRIQEPITNPASGAVNQDAALTIAAASIRTIGGYIRPGGSLTQVYVAGNYSITVKNSRGEFGDHCPTSSGTLEALLAAVECWTGGV